MQIKQTKLFLTITKSDHQYRPLVALQNWSTRQCLFYRPLGPDDAEEWEHLFAIIRHEIEKMQGDTHEYVGYPNERL